MIIFSEVDTNTKIYTEFEGKFLCIFYEELKCNANIKHEFGFTCDRNNTFFQELHMYDKVWPANLPKKKKPIKRPLKTV